MTMLKIPAGKFQMGTKDDVDVLGYGKERPVHDVSVSAFWLSDREVTLGQLAAGGTKAEDEPREIAREAADREYPAAEITWFDAVKFCNDLSQKESLNPYYKVVNIQPGVKSAVVGQASRLSGIGQGITSADVTVLGGDGYRLPTEAEWEYACRAKSATLFCYGDEDLDDPVWLSNYAVYNKNGTAVCGSKLPNAWGLFDMHGNVLEWCQDWFSEDYYSRSPTSNPLGPTEGSVRVLRGGGGSAVSCRSAYRLGVDPESRFFALGFRVARSLSGKQLDK